MSMTTTVVVAARCADPARSVRAIAVAWSFELQDQVARLSALCRGAALREARITWSTPEVLQHSGALVDLLADRCRPALVDNAHAIFETLGGSASDAVLCVTKDAWRIVCCASGDGAEITSDYVANMFMPTAEAEASRDDEHAAFGYSMG